MCGLLRVRFEDISSCVGEVFRAPNWDWGDPPRGTWGRQSGCRVLRCRGLVAFGALLLLPFVLFVAILGGLLAPTLRRVGLG